jgi:CO/xanthine dehydrogenase Mo-binding subunit
MKKRGRGFATVHYPTGMTCGGDPSQAVVRMKEDGTVDLMIGTVDHGMGAKTVFAQMAAQELGVPFESVTVTNADTDTTPLDTGSFASRATHMVGNAVTRACAEARQIILDLASPELGVPAEELELRDGSVVVRAVPEQAIPIADVAGKGIWGMGKIIVGRGSYTSNTTKLNLDTGEGRPFDTYAYATTIADVEVDTETGEVTLLKLTSDYDVGKAVNPLLVEGQVEGGSMFGVGMALTEDLTPYYPNTNFQPVSFADYMIPTSKDVPELVTTIVEHPSTTGPYGVKGTGEFTSNSEAPAIINAIYNAVGVRICDLPARPDKILKGLKEKGAR